MQRPESRLGFRLLTTHSEIERMPKMLPEILTYTPVVAWSFK